MSEQQGKYVHIRKRQGVISLDMSPGGEGPLTRQIRALSQGEKGPKHKANVLQIGPNFAGVAHCWYLLTRTEKIRKHTDTVVAFTRRVLNIVSTGNV
jgi:hypothetical protein